MIKNYLKVAWRNLLKHKSFSLINILGLAMGIAACMTIFIYVRHELTYDQFNIKSDRIVRATIILHAPESDIALATAPTPLANLAEKDYPEVESAVRIETSPLVITYNNELFREAGCYKADQSIFSVFSFQFLEGSPEGALVNPNSIVISESFARKYFPDPPGNSQHLKHGKTSAVGKILFCNQQKLLVTGIFADRPFNSDLRFDAIQSNDFSKITSWIADWSLYTFILFHKKPDLKSFKRKLDQVGIKYVQPELNATGDKNYSVSFEVEPLAAVHFSKGKLMDTPKGNRQYNYIFSLLAIFILVIALLNYINLSTAKSSERAKEVGIRKVSGAGQFQLIRQFLFESLLIVACSCIVSLILVRFSLPFLNTLLQTTLTIHWMEVGFFLAAIFLLTLLLAGLYPAFVLAGFRPVQVLKGNWRHGAKGVLLRKTVTIAQFAIAAALIMGTTVIYTQMKFIEHKDLGYNKDQLLAVYLPDDSVLRYSVKSFQDELRQRPEIQDMTIGTRMTEDGLTIGPAITESDGKRREMMCNFFHIDPNYLRVFQIKLLEGRNLSDSFSSDKTQGFLVNEAFVKEMGWTSGLGKPLEGIYRKGKIVGVVKNFNYKSLHNRVEPLVMIYNDVPHNNTATIKIKPRDLPMVKGLFKKYFPSRPYDYEFFDEIVNKLYQQDRVTMSLFNGFTLLAIFVSCLGLYGLVALIAIQRKKEIGIRKVLGASISQLLGLMSKDFMKLALWSLIIALPVSGLLMNKWLAGYAYHVQMVWWMFLIPVLLLLIIALMVVSQEIVRTALANPINSLRTE